MFPLPPGIEGGDPANARLAPPPMPENPTQADLGAQVYYQVCMVCHGDRGQGLTDEWRGVLDPEDQDCWQSGCHHTKHPEGGFIFPKIVPPVVGAGALSHYPTARHLHDYLQARMPWQARGTRSAEEYWQLTAFLLRANGVDPGPGPLDAPRAAEIILNPAQATALAQPEQTPAPTPSTGSGSLSMRNSPRAGLACVGASLLAGLIIILIAYTKFR
jgi:mono/diheme cytochrome c family protein